VTGRLQTQLALDLGHRQALDREDFLIAPCNEEVVAWLDRWPNWPGKGLIIQGPVGCGKTHLAYVFRSMSGARLVSAANVVQEDIYGCPPHIVVEDIESNVNASALLHLYNSTIEQGGTILFTSLCSASSWQFELPDLQSRLNVLGSAVVGLPDDTLLAAVLMKLLADRQLKVGEDVVMYLVRRMERSFQMARKIVQSLDEASLEVRREITIPLARQILDRRAPSEKE
jgi:chromosomal replication initiation ATPase DnaA